MSIKEKPINFNEEMVGLVRDISEQDAIAVWVIDFKVLSTSKKGVI